MKSKRTEETYSNEKILALAQFVKSNRFRLTLRREAVFQRFKRKFVVKIIDFLNTLFLL